MKTEKSKLSVTRTNNGNLRMRINGKRPLRQLERILRIHGTTETAEAEFIFQFLSSWNLIAEKPESVGALTSAPLITDGVSVYGFMDYQIRSFLTELAEGKTVEWQKGQLQATSRKRNVMNANQYEPTETNPCNGGVQKIFRFANGYEASD